MARPMRLARPKWEVQTRWISTPFTFSNAASPRRVVQLARRDDRHAFAHRSEGESNVAEHLACGRGIRVKKAVDEDQLHAVLNVLRHTTNGQHCPSKSRSCRAAPGLEPNRLDWHGFVKRSIKSHSLDVVHPPWRVRDLDILGAIVRAKRKAPLVFRAMLCSRLTCSFRVC